MQISALPAGILDVICSLLTGFDSFYLSRTSSYWLQYFSDDTFWQRRVLGYQDLSLKAPWKQEYLRARSLLFTSSHLVPQWQGDHPITRSFSWLQRFPSTTSNQILHQFDLRTWLKHSINFDTWFFLLPATEDQVAGGIIFGGQFDRPTSDHSPQYYQPLVIVDSKFTLCCSVLADSEPVKHNLLPNRWYHLALTFEWDIRRQTVYLNGENVSCEDGILPRDWCRLSYQQVGTGYTRKHEDFQRRDPFGWYTFHGVVDAFRVWEGVVGAKAVQKLFQGGDLQEKDCVLKATIDRAEDGRKPWVNTQLVRCSRPCESKYAQLDQ